MAWRTRVVSRSSMAANWASSARGASMASRTRNAAARDAVGASESTCLFARVVVLRTLLTVADGAEPIAGDPLAGQIRLHRVGAPVAQRQVVFRRPDVARVPLDRQPQRRVLLHGSHRLVEHPRRL